MKVLVLKLIKKMMHFISKDPQMMLTNVYYYTKILYEGDGVEVNKKEASRYLKCQQIKEIKREKKKLAKMIIF